MYEITYGNRYDGTLTTTQVAAKVRADVKAAVKAGDLPDTWKFHVRSSYFANGSSIDVAALSPNPVWTKDYDVLDPYADIVDPVAKDVKARLEAIVRSYNFDGSDTQTDYWHVAFYSNVSVRPMDGVPQFPGAKVLAPIGSVW